jgi:glutaredoxin 3
MPPIEIYTTPLCGYCHAAKRLLDAKGAPYVEHDVSRDRALRAQMEERAGRRTTPQIWIGETHVGGYDDLAALERGGKLAPLLQGDAA